jgi:hypothetical protein
LIALHVLLLLYLVFDVQLGTTVIFSLFLLREFCRYYLGKIEKDMSIDYFLVWTFFSLHRFDFTLHANSMMLFPYSMISQFIVH